VGERKTGSLRVRFDSQLKLDFHGAKVTSDAGLLAYRELDGALGLTEMSEKVLHDARTGANVQHSMVALLRQAVYGRLLRVTRTSMTLTGSVLIRPFATWSAVAPRSDRQPPQARWDALKRPCWPKTRTLMR